MDFYGENFQLKPQGLIFNNIDEKTHLKSENSEVNINNFEEIQETKQK